MFQFTTHLSLQRFLSRVLSIVVGCNVGWFALGAWAHEDPPNCSLANGGLGNTSQGGINFPVPQAHIGDTVDIQPSLGMVQNACLADSVTGAVYVATGLLTNFLIDVTLTPGNLVVCPAGADCQPGPYHLLITPALVGAGVISPNGSVPGIAKVVRAVENGFGSVHTGPLEEALADFHSASITIVSPCIGVTKFCSQACYAPGQTMTFSGIVTNCGDIILTNIVAVDSKAGPLLLLNPFPPFNPITTLAPGGFARYTVNYTPTAEEVCGSVTNTVIVTAQDNSTIGGPNSFVSNSVTVACDVCPSPAIVVTKSCPHGPVPPGGVLAFTGTVTNTGDITLTNVIVFNNQPISNFTVLGPITLTPGEGTNFTQNYTVPLGSCGPYSDTVTAIGQSICGGVSVTNIAMAECPGTNTPCLAVSRDCTGPVLLGSSQMISGTVTNCGNISITNIAVSDSILGLITNFQALSPGDVTNYSVSFTATVCGPTPATVTVSGTSICGASVQSTASSSCVVTCAPPHICVLKEVACYIDDTNGCDTFGPSAIGVSGDTQDPAFCYRISVTNCGEVTLTNVVVNDNQFEGIATNFPSMLAPGGGAVYVFKAQLESGLTNIVTASGRSALTGEQVSTNAPAVVQILPASVRCSKLISIDGGALASSATLEDQNSHTIVWYVVVENTSRGGLNLEHLTIADSSTNPGCGIAPPSFSVNYGASTAPIPVCTNANYVCAGATEDLINSVVVTADEFSIGTNHIAVCAHDINGSNILVRSECEATLHCEAPSACRVTGGGRQDDPLVYPADVRYVTHGGQVGAPVGERVCEVLPELYRGNPCIHGRWEHVRHMKGGLRGNFHARFFDTLDCACLDTNVGPGGVYGPGTLLGKICNPDDRASGPLPRPASANKIVFTGIGDYTTTNGRRVPRTCLFRVDIEDRSEPGNSHAGGGKAPADRYRLRIWLLTPDEVARLNNPSDGLLAWRNEIAACNGLNVRDGVDMPNGTPVFTQNMPPLPPGQTRVFIDDGGELERGNQQIHPMIQHCDSFNPTGPGFPRQ